MARAATKHVVCSCRISYLPTMGRLRGDFEHFYPLDDDAVMTAIKTGLVAFDTNVLLTLYRWQGEGRAQLFGALEKLGDRLWIPHQVGLEFQRRRLDVIAEKEKYLKTTQRDLDSAIKGLRDWAEGFGVRIGLDQGRVAAMSEAVNSLRDRLAAEVTDARKVSDVSLRGRDRDPVLTKLEILLDNRVGEKMEPEALKAARKEAMRRVAERIPPGYEDAGKTDPTGDYLVFRQLMDEAKKGHRPVVFVTDDQKPDWYWRIGDLYLGARPELRDEMMMEAGVPFVIMPTATFLIHAKEYLGAEVSRETVDHAEREYDVPDLHWAQLRAAFTTEVLKRVFMEGEEQGLSFKDRGLLGRVASQVVSELTDVQLRRLLRRPDETPPEFLGRAVRSLDQLPPMREAPQLVVRAINGVIHSQAEGELDLNSMILPDGPIDMVFPEGWRASIGRDYKRRRRLVLQDLSPGGDPDIQYVMGDVDVDADDDDWHRTDHGDD